MELLKYFFLLLPMSMTSIGFLPNVRITLADLAMISIIVYGILFKKKIKFDVLSILSCLLFIIIFVVNVFNIILVENLNINKVLLSYSKMIYFMFILFIFPTYLKKDNLEIFFKSIILIITFHSVVLFFDATTGLPISIHGHMIYFDGSWEQMYRPNGLFGEPSFFGIFVLTYLGLLIQYEINTKINVINFWHFALICIGLFTAKSVTCYLSLIIFFIYYFYKNLSYKIVFIFLPVIVLLFLTSFIELDLREVGESELKTFMSKNLIDQLFIKIVYFKERILNFLTFSDGSSIQRILGSFLYTINVLEQRPFLGSGLGGENLSLIYKDKDFYSLDYLIFNTHQIVPLTYSQTTFFAFLAGSGGILSLLFFYFLIIVYILLKKETRYYGVIILIVGFASGGFLEPHFWTSIAVCISLKEVAQLKT